MKHIVSVLFIIVLILVPLYSYSMDGIPYPKTLAEQKMEFCENITLLTRYANILLVGNMPVDKAKERMTTVIQMFKMDIPEIRNHFYTYITVFDFLLSEYPVELKASFIRDIPSEVYNDCMDDLLDENDF